VIPEEELQKRNEIIKAYKKSDWEGANDLFDDLLSNGMAMDPQKHDGSSEEDIDDKAFEERHREGEAEERARFHAFTSNRKGGDGLGRSMMPMGSASLGKRKESALTVSREIDGASRSMVLDEKITETSQINNDIHGRRSDYEEEAKKTPDDPKLISPEQVQLAMKAMAAVQKQSALAAAAAVGQNGNGKDFTLLPANMQAIIPNGEPERQEKRKGRRGRPPGKKARQPTE
jgi:hypothetical protein